MSNWIKAINPTGAITTEADAIAAARASAIAIFIGVAFGLIGLILIMNGMDEVRAAAEAEVASNPQVAGMGGAIAQGILYFGIAVVVIQAVLGIVQWIKPNLVIPILFLVLVVYGLGTGILELLNPKEAVAGMSHPAPWLKPVSLVAMAVQLILHIAGARGASALNKMRRAG